MEESFIFGNALKVSPILTSNVRISYSSYFPKGKWVSMIDMKVVDGGMAV